jgi:hypothetical protein
MVKFSIFKKVDCVDRYDILFFNLLNIDIILELCIDLLRKETCYLNISFLILTNNYITISCGRNPVEL